jgi:hypothetical protein
MDTRLSSVVGRDAVDQQKPLSVTDPRFNATDPLTAALLSVMLVTDPAFTVTAKGSGCSSSLQDIHPNVETHNNKSSEIDWRMAGDYFLVTL